MDLEQIKKRSVSATQVTLDKPKTSLYAEYYAADVPTLVTEVERLTSELEKARADQREMGRLTDILLLKLADGAGVVRLSASDKEEYRPQDIVMWVDHATMDTLIKINASQEKSS